MAPRHDQDHPSKQGHSIYGITDSDWLDLRMHALTQKVTASEIVVALLHQYLDWPSEQQAATLDKIRGDR